MATKIQSSTVNGHMSISTNDISSVEQPKSCHGLEDKVSYEVCSVSICADIDLCFDGIINESCALFCCTLPSCHMSTSSTLASVQIVNVETAIPTEVDNDESKIDKCSSTESTNVVLVVFLAIFIASTVFLAMITYFTKKNMRSIPTLSSNDIVNGTFQLQLGNESHDYARRSQRLDLDAKDITIDDLGAIDELGYLNVRGKDDDTESYHAVSKRDSLLEDEDSATAKLNAAHRQRLMMSRNEFQF